jgi:peptide/nickel transport system permease protein
MALDVGWVILIGAALSFVGLGEQPPTPGFGQMISEGARYMPDLWWMTVFPALAIAFIILGFNFFGDGIRDMLERGR